MNNLYYNKYLKYKNKYLELLKINGGDVNNNLSFYILYCNILFYI